MAEEETPTKLWTNLLIKKKKTVRLRKGNNKDDDEMKETSTGFQRQENILSETMKSDWVNI